MSKLPSVSEADFDQDVLNASGLTLVDYWATWCGPCRMLAPTLEDIQSELGDKIKIVKVNIEESPSIAMRYRIQNIPFMVLFKDGEHVDQLLGNQPKSKIMSMINTHLD